MCLPPNRLTWPQRASCFAGQMVLRNHIINHFPEQHSHKVPPTPSLRYVAPPWSLWSHARTFYGGSHFPVQNGYQVLPATMRRNRQRLLAMQSHCRKLLLWLEVAASVTAPSPAPEAFVLLAPPRSATAYPHNLFLSGIPEWHRNWLCHKISHDFWLYMNQACE